MSATPLVGVLLAAGSGSRLGLGPKALLQLGDAPEPQVVRLARVLREGGCTEVIVVLGAAAGEVRRVLGPGEHQVVVNQDWAEGMGSSFALGMGRAARILPATSAGMVMVALVDQPDLSAGVVSFLRSQATSHRVTAAAYPDKTGGLRRGHPIIFPRDLGVQAAALAAGDSAGRAWLGTHPELVDLVDVSHLADGRDLDTPEDLRAWQERRGTFHGR
ncbi:Nicotine blue oxidoreductase [Corynebacterium occultum]|uniref:Nicotine blue oxidoreductase n=1 Tax=Corynebacterium occultum TaxID=2675219 RepID=A0A6B8VP67_9CORY|nr:nucleotidyltransferase family protein [Corynebacterium occultum]QGU07362.1 Nicotine blue oxidoreductase [Corynebacterium occultum]